MQTQSTYPRLVGDIGGTNARFGWIESQGGDLEGVAAYPAADFPTLLDAMQRYLQDHGRKSPRWCAIGIANPVVGDHVKMTNHHWSFSISDVQRKLGMGRFLVINDFTALALSLPALRAEDLRQVGGGARCPMRRWGWWGLVPAWVFQDCCRQWLAMGRSPSTVRAGIKHWRRWMAPKRR